MVQEQASFDKEVERKRYDARTLGDVGGEEALRLSGADSVPYALRAPYLYYEELIRSHVTAGMSVLDVCAGTGLHSLTAARMGAYVTATDIAANSLEIARERARIAGIETMQFVVSDAEALPFPDGSFDVITCAGSLSYVDPDIFLPQLFRLLKPAGTFIAVDSFDHNPIYRLNRYVHYLRGNRSLSTLKRMPDARTLRKIRGVFGDLQVNYFGIFSFTAGLIARMAGENAARMVIDKLDRWCRLFKRYSFKIVIFTSKHLPL